MLGVDKTHGLWWLLDVILLSIIEGIYTFNAINLDQNTIKKLFKTIKNIMHYIRYIKNCKKNPSKSKKWF